MSLKIQAYTGGSKERSLFLLAYSIAFVLMLLLIVRVYLRHDSFGIWDFPFIFDFANDFIKTGFLYSQDASLYKPSVPTGYPHPPLSPSLLIFVIKLGFSREAIFNFLSFAHVVCFVGAVCCCWYGAFVKRSLASLFAIFFVAGLMMPTMENNLMTLLLEPCLLFIVCLSLVSLSRGHDFLAGSFIGVGAMLKIYPGIFLLYFLLTRRWKSVSGAAFAGFVCLLFSVFVMGVEQNVTYFFVALPQQLKELPYLFFYENTSLPSYALYFDLLSPEGAKRIGTVIFLALLFLSLYPSSMEPLATKNKNMIMSIDYAVIVALLVLCMPNSWWNYQIHLLVPAVVVAIFLIKQDRVRWGLLSLFVFSIISLSITVVMSIDNDIQYFIDMDNSVRMTYIVLRGLPNIILFGLPFFIRWQIFLGKPYNY
ncbi:MAG: glycosyltransferase family 87 protein [Pseudomonadales bacterium]